MKKYVIRKGNHSPLGIRFKRYKHGDLVIFGKFNLNCWHYYDDIPESGKNKLSGITFGLKGVHKNSIRIAWQPDKVDGRINLFIYCYNKGLRKVDQIGSVNVCELFRIRILFGIDSFQVRFKDFEKKYLFSIPNTAINYFNFPYFGGNSKAPWDIDIFLHTQNSYS